MSSKQNEELKWIAYEYLCNVIKQSQDVLTMEEFGSVLATCFTQEQLNFLSKDIFGLTSKKEIEKVIQLQKRNYDSFSTSINKALKG